MSIDIRLATAAIREYHPVAWDQIPDFGLYMDQVVTFIARVYAPLYGDDVQRRLSPSMINNYVKARLIPRPMGKKYSRDQLALLIMIVTLKQASGMEDIHRMLTLSGSDTVEALYGRFCARFDDALKIIRLEHSEPLPPDSALDYAILAAAYSAACSALLAAEPAAEDGQE